MIVVEKNAGAKIEFEVAGKKITFDDDLTINLAKREQDWAAHSDICFNQDDELVIGAATGWRYVAEIDIPERQYREVEVPGENGEEPSVTLEPVPLDMDTVMLTLWELE